MYSLRENKWTYVKFQIPTDKFIDARRQYYCTHGCFDAPRGGGVRDQLHYRYTGCQARVTLVVTKIGGKLGIVVVSEVCLCLKTIVLSD